MPLSPVASEILLQLGGNRFCAMTGAKNFVYNSDLLQFDIGRNAKRITKVQIKLTNEDLYTVAFYKGRGLNLVPACQPLNGVYAENLQEVFTRHTGLETRL